MARTLSDVRPQRRLSQPNPPPTARPATPVRLTTPAGAARPWTWVAASKSAQTAPGWTLMLLRSGSTIRLRIAARSMTTPSSQIADPDTLWPPLRTDTRQPAPRRGVERHHGVVGVGTPGDKRGSAIDGAVPQPPRVVIAGSVRVDQDALERVEWIHVAPSPGSMGGGRSKHNPHLGDRLVGCRAREAPVADALEQRDAPTTAPGATVELRLLGPSR